MELEKLEKIKTPEEVLKVLEIATVPEDPATKLKREKKEAKAEKKKKSKYYVDSDEFQRHIVICHRDNVINDGASKCIYDIANRLSFAPNFINYSFKEEMVGDAIIKMITALKNKRFDPLKGNAFSYYTMIAFRAFCNRIKKEKRIRDAISSYQQEVYDTYVGAGQGHIVDGEPEDTEQ